MAAGILIVAIVAAVCVSLSRSASEASATVSPGDRVKAQARELLMAINGAGSICGAVTRVFLQGVDREKRFVYWSAACFNGTNYQVRVSGDGAIVTDCAKPEIGSTACFTPLSDQ